MQTWKNRANKAIRRGLSPLKVPPPQALSEWSEKHFYLSSESSYTTGRWHAYPYQTAILDAFGNDDIEEVSVKKSSRTGYTKMLLAAVAYFVSFRRRNIAVWQPTDSDAEEFVATELDPMLRDVRPIKSIFPALEKKHKHNTNSYKKFLGSSLYIKGGTSARNYRRISIDVGILDEIDAFDKDIDKEGSARKLSKKRTEGSTFPKQITGSTPKLKYISEIVAAVETADTVYLFYIPCPHCKEKQVLEFGGVDVNYGLKWIDKNPETAAYLCKFCDCLFTQAEYLRIWDQGVWRNANGDWYDHQAHVFKNSKNEKIIPESRIAFDNLWTIYSPQCTWAQIVREFIDAAKKAKHGDKSDLKTYINTTLGQAYEEDAEKIDTSELKQRAEDYPLQTVPSGGILLMAGVDVQKDRFELTVWAFGRGEEMWAIDYHVIEANPADEKEWNKLDPYLLNQYPHYHGAEISMHAVAIDTGGHWTHQSYNFARNRQTSNGWSMTAQIRKPPKIYATKGASAQGGLISGRSSLRDVNLYNKSIRNGVRLHLIGTDTAKDLLHGRLQVEHSGPGYIHFSNQLTDQFYNQLSAEVRVVKLTVRGEESRWVPKRAGIRNEVLDCTVMALFCAHKAGLHLKTKRQWDMLEEAVYKAQMDIFSQTVAANQAKKPSPGFKEVTPSW